MLVKKSLRINAQEAKLSKLKKDYCSYLTVIMESENPGKEKQNNVKKTIYFPE